MFVIGCAAIWIGYTILLRWRLGDSFELSTAILPLVLFSCLITLDLGINYVAAAIPQLNDGISIHGSFGYLIFGDGGWSIERFKNTYDASMIISFVLIIVFAGLQLVRAGRKAR